MGLGLGTRRPLLQKMKTILMFYLFYFCKWTEAQHKTYMVTAPKVLRLDAIETVVIQLFGYEQDSTVSVSLKSYPDKLKTFATQPVTLTAANHYQDAASLRLFPKDFPKEASYVYLEAKSSDFTKDEKVMVIRTNGYLFIQTDKPLYTPEQAVKVRVFSLNEELKPALRPVSLTFLDPEAVKVDVVEMRDVSGIVSMQAPFKIPLNPKFGIWKIEAKYTDDFSTQATAEFEIKEYVLPSISILIQPEANYITATTFESFKITVTARYFHGSPVSSANVFLTYGYIEGHKTILMPQTITKEQLIDGKLEVFLNMKLALERQLGDWPRTLQEMDGKFLYVAVTVQEDNGGISQDVELASVKFLQAPYTLSLVATSAFIKPGLPYFLRVLVKDPNGQPVGGVPVKVFASFTKRDGEESTLDYSGGREGHGQTSHKDGTTLFLYNIPYSCKAAVFNLQTTDETLLHSSQAKLRHETTMYNSINDRYLYIDWVSHYHQLHVGEYVSIKINFQHHSNILFKTFSYQVISRGKIVKFDTVVRHEGSAQQAINFKVTSDMVPSARLLVYYIMIGENKPELVADSVWMDIKEKCINGLQMQLSAPEKTYKPQDNLALKVEARHNSLVAFSSTDTALYSLRASSIDPLSTALRHFEQSDLGCGAGGGRDNADVFRLCGLTFLTNANAKAAQSQDDTCSTTMRPKRSDIRTLVLDKGKLTEQTSPALSGASSHKEKFCCLTGMKKIPFLETCHSKANRLRPPNNTKNCKIAFIECCQFRLDLQNTAGSGYVLARMELEVYLGWEPSRLRSYFPESWLWETHRVSGRSGLISLNKKLPDSLTTWEIKAVEISSDGICVSDALRVQVSQDVSLDVPLPYSMVRGEQLELRGSVYNQINRDSWFCVTLTAPKGICLFRGRQSGDGQSQSTPCMRQSLQSNSVNPISFTLMALEAGSHILTFTLKTPLGSEAVVKTLRVVPEGVKTEVNVGGTLDPQGVFGIERRRLEFKNSIPLKLVPKSTVERLLTVTGELFGEVISIINDPNGLQQLTRLPHGSAEAEIMNILPVFYVFHYLEKTNRWDLLGPNPSSSRMELMRKLREGVTGIMSFKRKTEHAYSMWKDREASTWVTALVMKTLGQVNNYIAVDHRSLCNSLFWVESKCQNTDGSFKELSDYKPVKLMGAGANAKEKTAFITAFTIIGIKHAMEVPACNLQEFKDVLKHAVDYLSNNFKPLKSLYVRAITAYALALVDRGSMPAREIYERLQNYAQVKGSPAIVRFWQEEGEPVNPLVPNKATAQSVETTVYVLLTALLYGDNQYAAPILRWLTQDQRYGGGFYSTQDTILTLEALMEYSQLVQHAKLDMEIRASYRTKGDLDIIKLSQKQFVGKSVQVMQADDVILSTGSSMGVSVANIKTVFYSTTESNDNCHFDLTIETHPSNMSSTDFMFHLPRLIACARYKPIENEVYMESAHAVFEIHLPTGIEPVRDDLDVLQNGLDSIVSYYEIQRDKVIIQVDSIPSNTFLCVGFRIQEFFRVGMQSSSQFKVYEYHDPDSKCSKLYRPNEERRLLQLCEGDECQCMAADCSNLKPPMDLTITAQMRLQAACSDKIRYAFKVKIESSVGEGDFVNYAATIEDIFKKGSEKIQRNSKVTFVRKATCTNVNLQDGEHYLIMGVEGMETVVRRTYKYKFPLDSQAWVERWPSGDDCKEGPCSDFESVMEDFAENFLLMGC